MFRVELLPAKHGDAILIEYGQGTKRSRVLIDGGPTNAGKALGARIAALAGHAHALELLVITHVDADHIEGIVRLLRSKTLCPPVREVWFNGWQQLSDKLGPVQGEYLSALIGKLRLPWNTAFGERAVAVPDKGELPFTDLPGGMRLTMLSPTAAKLARLRKEWKKVVEAAGLAPGLAKQALDKLEKAKGLAPLDRLGDWVTEGAAAAERPDRATANGSSIAFLAEYKGVACLFLGDAHPDVVAASLARLRAERREDTLRVDALKLSHHGSRNNLNLDILKQIRCRRYLISTNGDRFGHPDMETIARLIKFGGPAPELYFNYPHTKSSFGVAADTQRYGYKAIYPARGQEGIVVSLPDRA